VIIDWSFLRDVRHIGRTWINKVWVIDLFAYARKNLSSEDKTNTISH